MVAAVMFDEVALLGALDWLATFGGGRLTAAPDSNKLFRGWLETMTPNSTR